MLGEVAKLTKNYLSWIDYKENGAVQAIPQYMNKNHGKSIMILDETFISYTLTHTTYKHGIAHGICQSWYRSGQKHDKFYFKHGKLSGTYKRWYDNGQIATKLRYVNGLKHGKEIKWDRNGQIEYEKYWINGHKN